jgi:hypothetical protein
MSSLERPDIAYELIMSECYRDTKISSIVTYLDSADERGKLVRGISWRQGFPKRTRTVIYFTGLITESRRVSPEVAYWGITDKVSGTIANSTLCDSIFTSNPTIYRAQNFMQNGRVPMAWLMRERTAASS